MFLFGTFIPLCLTVQLQCVYVGSHDVYMDLGDNRNMRRKLKRDKRRKIECVKRKPSVITMLSEAILIKFLVE